MQFRTQIAESSTDSATLTQLISFDSFAKGLHPSPRSPYAPKAPLFAFRESASLSPLLAKNQRSHYCSLFPIFCTTKRASFRVLRTNYFYLDSADSQNLVKTIAHKVRTLTKFLLLFAFAKRRVPLPRHRKNRKAIRGNP